MFNETQNYNPIINPRAFRPFSATKQVIPNQVITVHN